MATRFLMHSCKHWFMSSVYNFCRWGANIPPGKLTRATRSKERQLLLQATLSNVVLLFKLPVGDNKHLNFEGNGVWKGTNCFFFLVNMPHLTTVTQNVLSVGRLSCKIKRHWMHSHLAILDISLIRESGQTIIVKKSQLIQCKYFICDCTVYYIKNMTKQQIVKLKLWHPFSCTTEQKWTKPNVNFVFKPKRLQCWLHQWYKRNLRRGARLHVGAILYYPRLNPSSVQNQMKLYLQWKIYEQLCICDFPQWNLQPRLLLTV